MCFLNHKRTAKSVVNCEKLNDGKYAFKGSGAAGMLCGSYLEKLIVFRFLCCLDLF